MTATREQAEQTILDTWNYVNWKIAGCEPPEQIDLIERAEIRGYARGYLGRHDYDRLRARLIKWPRIDQPAALTPVFMTMLDLMELVR